jgi:hypothetical protein
VKDSNPNVHVRVFKAANKINDETKNAEFVNMFSFTFTDNVFD